MGVESADEILGVDNCLFTVGNLEQAREHYRVVIGLVETFSFPGAGLVGYALGPEPAGLMLREDTSTPMSGPRGPHVWVEVRDAERLADHLSRRAAISSGLRDIRTGRVFEIADPWGNVLGFTDYVFDPDRGRGAT
jgi:hypothetical protein